MSAEAAALAATSGNNLNSEALPAGQVLGSLVTSGQVYAGVRCEKYGKLGVWYNDCIRITSVRQLLEYAGVSDVEPEPAQVPAA